MSHRHTSQLALGDVASIGKALILPFSNRTAPNRILKAAMTEHLASWDEKDRTACGIPADELVNLYRRWGEGQSGIVLSGNIMVVKESLETRGNMIIPPEALPVANNEGGRFDGFARVGAAGKASGSLMIGQISHPGRQVTADINPNPVSASDVQLTKSFLGPQVSFGKPKAATLEEIAEIKEAFIHAAEYLEAAGWDGVQLHGAHGYLLAQFLSRSTNLRTDEYGGSLENRARIIAEIAQGIRARCSPNFVLGIKLNSVEFQDGGLQPDEAAVICAILEREKFDFVELSGGTYEEMSLVHKRDSTRAREGFFLDFAEQIIPSLKQTKSYITGGFKTANAITNALKTLDGVGMGRALAQEPDLPIALIEGKVQAAIKSVVHEDEFARNGMVAGVHMRQLGEGKDPFDTSDEKEMKRLDEVAVPAYMEKIMKGEFVSWPEM